MTAVSNWLSSINFAQIGQLLYSSSLQTLYMVFVASIITFILALPLGVFLLVTSKGNFYEMGFVNRIIGAIVNALRSLPFVVLMVAIMPITVFIVGTRIGTTAAIIPLIVGTVPFTARLFETSLRTVSSGLIEAAQSMGASSYQIVRRVLIPEAMPELIQNCTITVIVLISNSAMAGMIGGGGLGDLALRYGYMRFRLDIMIATVIMLIVMVQLVQMLGDYLSAKFDHR